MNINVFAGRAEDYQDPPAEVVTLRAVERFENALPIAASLVALEGRLAILISQAQLAQVHDLARGFSWATPASHSPIRKPHSRHWHSITRNQAG